MAQLNVKAEAITGWILPPSSKGPEDVATPILVVSVTAADGKPVSGLYTSMEVHVMIDEQLGPKFQAVSAWAVKEQLPGIYVLGVYPAAAPDHHHRYVYSVRVHRSTTHGSDDGQTLTSLARFLP